MTPLTLPIDEVVKFCVLLTRIGGIMVFFPFFSSLNIPVTLRVAFVLGLSALLHPVLAPSLGVPPLHAWSLAWLVAGELLIGMTIGLISRFLFAAFELAGQLLGFQMGFSMINAIDPQTSVQSTVLSVSQSLVALLIFIGLDSHHWLIRTVCDSFTYLAPLRVQLPGVVADAMVRMAAEMFVLGFRLAAPVLVVLVLTDVVFAIVGRAAPQVQILLVGLPLKSWLGFFLLGTSFYFVPSLMLDYLTTLHVQVEALLRRMAAPL